MTSISTSELKARLSAFIDIVREGDEVLVTDRGRPVARLTPVRDDEQVESRRVTFDDRLRDAAEREGFTTL